MDKINWICLSTNPNAIPLLEQNLDKIDWFNLSKNPNAEPLFFNIDYPKMRECFYPVSKEIIEYVFHTQQLQQMSNIFKIDVVDYLDLL